MTRKKLLFVGLLFIMIVIYSATSILSEYGTYTDESIAARQAYINQQKSSSDDDWPIADKGEVILENKNYILQLDTATTQFIVTDKKTNDQYFSYPEKSLNILSAEEQTRANSNLSILYYDSLSKEHYMGSYLDSVQKKQFKIKVKDNSIRIYYTLGTSISNLFAPMVFTKDVYENKILPGLKTNSDRRRIKLYYNLYSSSNKNEDFKQIASKYPAVNKQDLYILTNNLTPNILEEITGFVNDSGYTTEEYTDTMDQLGIEIENANIPAGFLVPMEISLENDGFIVKILSDKIKENNTTDKIGNVFLLEYFGAVDDKAKGYFFVPDGSGSIIDLNQKSPQSYSQHFYNDDLALTKKEQTQLSRNIPLPVFGISSDQGSYFAILNDSAASATLFAKTMGGSNSINNIYVVFNLRGVDQTDIGQARNMSILNVYAKHILYTPPQIHYVLMPDNQSNISDMAVIYKNNLQTSGVLSTETIESKNIPLYIDFICAASMKDNAFGISYNKKVVLSDIKSIVKVVRELQSKGIMNLKIRLKGWDKGGIYYGSPDCYQIDSKVGTQEELSGLADLLADNGGRLYLDKDFFFTSRNVPFDNNKLSLDISRKLDRSVASMQNYNRATLKYQPKLGMQFIITPMSYQKYIDVFIRGFKQTPENKNIGLSWSTGGMYLSSDFNVKTDYDMSMSAVETRKAFAKLNSGKNEMMTDYGYAYTLNYVKDIINAPLTDSSFTSETASIPFLQMVLSSSIELSGPALNMCEQNEQLLNMAASGTAPYYIFITGEDQLLKQVNMSNLFYSLNYKNSIDELEMVYKKMNEQIKLVYGKKITDYAILEDMITITTFENGYAIISNRSMSDFKYRNIIIPSKDYALVSGGGEIENDR